MSFTNYLENKILDHVFGEGAYDKPGLLEIGLSTTALEEDGTGATEPEDPQYVRVNVSNGIYDPVLGTGFWAVAVTAEEGSHQGKGVKASAAPVEFEEAGEDWDRITHFFITDGTNILGSGPLAQSQVVNEGDVVRFRAGELIITLD